MGRPDLSFTFTKINLWRQVQFRKIVYIDADVVALRAVDELFELDAPFAAAPDAGWPDAFNSGVMVITPNMGDYWALQTMTAIGDSFDGADQGLLNQYYEHRNWHRLSFTYNCTPNAEYQWEPAYRHYKSNIKMVHFIGKDKPWTLGRSRQKSAGVYPELLARWWAVYDRHLKAPVRTRRNYKVWPNHVGQAARLSSSSATTTTVHRHVYGESSNVDFGQSNDGYAGPVPEINEPEGTHTAEAPFTESGEPAENIEQGIFAPVPTVEQRRFSAPQMEWDATR